LAMVWTVDLLAAAIVGLLIYAALADVAARIIPDGVAIGLVALGVIERLLAGLPNLGASVLVALLLLVILVFLNARGLMGGGDVKLAAAIAIGLPVEAIYRFIVVTSLAGGILALVHLALRYSIRKAPRPPPNGASLARRVIAAERWRIVRHGSLPYGVAIACGGIWAVLACDWSPVRP
jgi:prepilin peptidase CpaA